MITPNRFIGPPSGVGRLFAHDAAWPSVLSCCLGGNRGSFSVDLLNCFPALTPSTAKQSMSPPWENGGHNELGSWLDSCLQLPSARSAGTGCLSRNDDASGSDQAGRLGWTTEGRPVS